MLKIGFMKVENIMKLNTENNMEKEILEMFKRIGVYTLGDLAIFKKHEQRKGEHLYDTIRRYCEELGDFNLEVKNEKY